MSDNNNSDNITHQITIITTIVMKKSVIYAAVLKAKQAK